MLSQSTTKIYNNNINKDDRKDRLYDTVFHQLPLATIEDFVGRNTSSLSVNFFMVDTHPLNANIFWYSGNHDLGSVYGTVKVNLINSNGTVGLQHSAIHHGGFDTFDFNAADGFVADRMRQGGNPMPYNFHGYGKGRIHITKPSIIEWLKY